MTSVELSGSGADMEGRDGLRWSKAVPKTATPGPDRAEVAKVCHWNGSRGGAGELAGWARVACPLSPAVKRKSCAVSPGDARLPARPRLTHCVGGIPWSARRGGGRLRHGGAAVLLRAGEVARQILLPA